MYLILMRYIFMYLVHDFFQNGQHSIPSEVLHEFPMFPYVELKTFQHLLDNTFLTTLNCLIHGSFIRRSGDMQLPMQVMMIIIIICVHNVGGGCQWHYIEKNLIIRKSIFSILFHKFSAFRASIWPTSVEKQFYLRPIA